MISATQSGRDGCDCPPAVFQCAHFDGRVVSLGDHSVSQAEHTCDTLWTEKRFGVATTSGQQRTCSEDCQAIFLCSVLGHQVFDDLPAAEAAFNEAALALRLAPASPRRSPFA